MDAVKTEPGGAASSPRPADSGIAVAALSLFQSRVKAHSSECGRAFSSLLFQLQQAVATAHRATKTPVTAGDDSAGAAACTAVADAVKASVILFQFLFEALYAHQLAACEELASGVEEALRQHPALSGSTAAATAMGAARGQLQEAVRALRAVPAQVQAAHAQGAELTARPPPPSTAGKTTPTPPARQPFAVSASYTAEERAAIARFVRQAFRRKALQLPPLPAAEEDAAAAALGCCCLVTEVAVAGTVTHTPMRHLLDSAKARRGGGGGGGDDDDGDEALLGLLADLDAAASIATQVERGRRAGSSDGSPLSSQQQQQQVGATSSFAEATALTAAVSSSLPSTAATSVPPSQSRKRGRESAVVVERASAGSGTLDAPSAMGNWGDALAYLARRSGAHEAADADGAPPEWEVAASQLVTYEHNSSSTGSSTGSGAGVGVGGAEAVVAVERRPPSEWVFQVSNSCRERRAEIVAAIQRLGSRVDTGSVYNPDTTHLVVADGVTERTEKYLCACAAGRLIVPPRYVLDSLRSGHWLLGRMERYNANPLRRYGPRGAAAMQRPFRGWRALLLVGHPAVANGIAAVLRAGGSADVQVLVFNKPAAAADGDGDGGGGGCTAGAPRIQLNAAAAEGGVGGEGPATIGRTEDGRLEGLDRSAVLSAALLDSCTHLLVECLSMSTQPGNDGNFELPAWAPPSLLQPQLYSRIFTLELLYHCLCASPEPPFDGEGRLVCESALTPSCRVEPFETA